MDFDCQNDTKPVREVPKELTREQAKQILEDKIRRYREKLDQVDRLTEPV